MTDSMVYGLQNRVILLASNGKAQSFSDLPTKLQSIKNEWDADGNPSLRAGISTAYKGLQSIKKTYEEANKTLAYLTSRNRTGYHSVRRHRVKPALFKSTA